VEDRINQLVHIRQSSELDSKPLPFSSQEEETASSMSSKKQSAKKSKNSHKKGSSSADGGNENSPYGISVQPKREFGERMPLKDLDLNTK
jgi:hypothetical protein